MPRRLSGAAQALVMFVVLSWSHAASALDPLALLLLRTLRDQIAMSIANAAVESALKRPDVNRPAFADTMPGLPPLGLPVPEQVRHLIDHNFTYLSGADRDTVYKAVMVRLDDPANAESRARLLHEFRLKALAIGDAQRALESLSRDDKQRLATGAATAFRRLPPDERSSIIGLLEAGHVPIPHDLNAMLLREISAH